MAYASDENFSIRTRIYRSIGQRPHPATIQLLQEATLDPHWFARAQAVRSLGWTCAPTFIDEMQRLRTGDPSPEVRRTATKALQRIVGFWLHFGQWQTIVTTPGAALEVARQLAEKGLATFADEVVRSFGWDDPAAVALSDELESLALERDRSDPEFEYHHHFAAAKAFEQAIEPARPEAAVRRLLQSDPDEQMEGLYIVSRHGMTNLVPIVVQLVADPGCVGWNARRVMRHLNLGDLTQRRFHRARFDA